MVILEWMPQPKKRAKLNFWLSLGNVDGAIEFSESILGLINA